MLRCSIPDKRAKGELATADLPGLPWTLGLITDRGRVRTRNEDAVGLQTDEGVVAIADGLGGNPRGDLASALAVARVGVWPAGPEEGMGDRIADLFGRIHEDLLLTAPLHAAAGMSTTLTVGVVRGPRLLVAHVGDCRLYRLRDEQFEQLTEDHRSEPGWLTRALGGPGARSDVDFAVHDLVQGDTYLWCSDGLHGVVADAVLAYVLRSTAREPMEDRLCHLVDSALAAGGPDNISAILMAARPPTAGTDKPAEQTAPHTD